MDGNFPWQSGFLQRHVLVMFCTPPRLAVGEMLGPDVILPFRQSHIDHV